MVMRVPRGRVGDGAAMPQLKPRPGASTAPANGEPSITASAPEAMALAMSPPVFMPPSVMIGTWRPVSRREPIAGRRDLQRGADLRHANAQYLARRAGRARADADQDGGGPLAA